MSGPSYQDEQDIEAREQDHSPPSRRCSWCAILIGPFEPVADCAALMHPECHKQSVDVDRREYQRDERRETDGA